MIKPLKSHNFNGNVYRIEHQARIRDDSLGECDFGRHVLRIPFDGDTRDELDTILHESLHACFPYLSEDGIDASASDVARLLWRLGWRKDPDIQ